MATSHTLNGVLKRTPFNFSYLKDGYTAVIKINSGNHFLSMFIKDTKTNRIDII